MKSPAPGKFFTATSRSPTEIRPSQAAAPPSITCIVVRYESDGLFLKPLTVG